MGNIRVCLAKQKTDLLLKYYDSSFIQSCIRFCHGNKYNHRKLVQSAEDVVVRFVGLLSRFCFYLEGKSLLKVIMRKCLTDTLREGMVWNTIMRECLN